MPTPQPPSLFWNNEIDPPIQQDATYEFDEFDRSYIDSQIRAIETKVLGLSISGGYSTVKHGGISLAQRAAVDFEGAGGTGVTGADVGGVSTIYITSPDLYDQDTTRAYGFADTGETIVPGNPTQIISSFYLDSTGGTPQFDLSATNIPNIQSGWIYILSDPTGTWGAGPPGLITTGGTVITVPGCPGLTSTFIQCPAFAGGSIAFMYDGISNAWRMLWCSGLGSWRSGSLTGPSQAGSAPIVSVPESTTVYTVTVTMRVMSVVGTPTEKVGDSWTTTAPLAWGNVSGTQSAIDDVLVGQSFTAAKTSMSAGASATQTDAGISFVTPSGLDAATVVSVTVTYTTQGNTSP